MKTSLLLLSFSHLVAALAATAQTPGFEAASIKANRSLGEISSIRLSKGRLSTTNVSLKKLMLNAYGIPDDREYMIEGPGWLATEHFDIEATFPGETPVTGVRQMMQTLLAERFKLALHRETRQLPTYALVVAGDGPKIHAVEEGQSGASGSTSGGPGRLEATRITMAKLAALLERPVGTPVTDSTGLGGVFTFTLEWSPDDTPELAARAGAEPGGAGGPSIFTAVQEQLGLKLVGGKRPVEILVVDHMEKAPSEN
jgi:uncharacterized protein (TIGR03435 family)